MCGCAHLSSLFGAHNVGMVRLPEVVHREESARFISSASWRVVSLLGGIRYGCSELPEGESSTAENFPWFPWFRSKRFASLTTANELRHRCYFVTDQYVWNLELREEGILSPREHVTRRIAFEVTVHTENAEFKDTFELLFEVRKKNLGGTSATSTHPVTCRSIRSVLGGRSCGS